MHFGRVQDRIQQKTMEATNLSTGKLPFKYLDVLLSSRELFLYQCEPLIDQIVSIIRHWTVNLLSYTGRHQLNKSVLFAITTY